MVPQTKHPISYVVPYIFVKKQMKGDKKVNDLLTYDTIFLVLYNYNLSRLNWDSERWKPRHTRTCVINHRNLESKE